MAAPAPDTGNWDDDTRFRGLREGRWWVHARWELPYRELYWNEPIEVEGGEPFTLTLSRQNAEVRPKF